MHRREMGIELSDVLAAGIADGAEDEFATDGEAKEGILPGGESDGDVYAQSAAAEGVVWERFQGAQQLQNPSVLNSRQVRTACVPGVSAHGSARALAAFYAALCAADVQGSGPLRLRRATLARAMKLALSGTLNGERVSWGLGLQLGQVADSAGRTYTLIGHVGLGGTVGMGVPECGVALAVTVSQLSAHCGASRRLVELMLRECGLTLKPGFLPETS